ncbi:MAG: hypothetical protein AB9842_08195 [Bacteroidales bacterium]
MESIRLFQAVRQMRKITSEGQTFSFTHVSYNRDSMKSDGIRHVRKAKLRPAAKNDDVTHSDHKLFYYDMEIQAPRTAWQALIIFFNGMKVIL